MRVAIPAKIYHWLIDRSHKSVEELNAKFSSLASWIEGKDKPTLKQLEHFAKTVHAPIGYLFVAEPLTENLPITDFRTFSGTQTRYPDLELLETIYDCQLKQDWYVDYCRLNGEDKNTFVASFTIDKNPKEVAKFINNTFFYHQQTYASWEHAFSERKQAIEKKGILIMSSGVVKGNPHRPLDLHEFRGFVLNDEYAPLIFINARDTTAARSFTLLHELAHVLLGESGVSNDSCNNNIERWCDEVAGEALVPAASLKNNYDNTKNLQDTINTLAKKYKVSTLTILNRLKNTKLLTISEEEFWKIYQTEKERLLKIIRNKSATSSGGNYYYTKPAAISKQFLKTLAISTLEGQTLYRDAMHLANVKNIKTFNNLVQGSLA